MRIAIIGAGAAGLCAAQQLSLIPNIMVVVYEQTGNIGGTWVYSDNVNDNEFGLPIHSSMYKNLRTNLPKETMEFLSFPFKHEKSFVSRRDVLQYLTDFVSHYGLIKYIKFFHRVLNVTPINETWEVSVKNLQTNEVDVSNFDVIMVCNGHFSQPQFPELPGMNKYRKIQLHSHEYRDPELFKGKTVAIVGSGPSGIDITFDVAAYAAKVIFSHHNEKLTKQSFSKNVIHKPDIRCLSENDIIFQDGTNEPVDVIIYCTGYKYSFPFLSQDCGITVKDNFVQPLYKQSININHPTMWFIGIPFATLVFPLFDLQVRCLINILLKKISLPSSNDMILDLQNDIENRKKHGEKQRYYHRLGNYMDDYLIELAKEFKAEPIPKVVHEIYDSVRVRRDECLDAYREDVYELIDSNKYVLYKNKLK